MGDTDNIRDWLTREKTKYLLWKVAEGAEKWLRANRIHPSFLPPPSFGGHDQGAENLKERIEEIESELQCFILEKGP